MLKFTGYDKEGNVITKQCVPHNYSDLPMKGLGKSMEGVGIDEPVIIPLSAALERIVWRYTEAEIDRRAYELKANINWMELIPDDNNQPMYQMWFSKSK